MSGSEKSDLPDTGPAPKGVEAPITTVTAGDAAPTAENAPPTLKVTVRREWPSQRRRIRRPNPVPKQRG